MAVFNVIAAKKAGYTEQEIADYLAEQSGFDTAAARQAGYKDDEIVSYLNKQEDMGILESFGAGFKAEAGSEITGLAQLAGIEPSASAIEEENLARVSSETNPIATGVGRFIGGLINPSTLIPGSAFFKGAKGVATAGAIGGGVSGFLRPIYDEEDLGRGASTAFGAVAGGALGGVLGKLFGKSATKAGEEVAGDVAGTAGKVEASTTAESATKVAEEPPFTETELKTYYDTLSKLDREANVDKIPDAIRMYEKIAAGEEVTPYEKSLVSEFSNLTEKDLKVIADFNTKVEKLELTPEGAQIFAMQQKLANGEQLTPFERSFYEEFFGNPNKSIFKPGQKVEAPAFKPVEEVTPTVQAAKVEPSPQTTQGVMEAAEETAFRTGDYRDFLRTSATRFASITPKQFARMIDPSNPFKNENVKVLLTKNENDQEVLGQIYGALQGRFKYERQAGKTFAEISEDFIPEEAAVRALLDRKVEEILPPEVTGAAVKATAKAISDLHNAQELARVAKDLGSDEAYAVLQAQMSQASALLASLEGNSSNLGRALAYQKELKQLIDANRQLPNYLGGFKC